MQQNLIYSASRKFKFSTGTAAVIEHSATSASSSLVLTKAWVQIDALITVLWKVQTSHHLTKNIAASHYLFLDLRQSNGMKMVTCKSWIHTLSVERCNVVTVSIFKKYDIINIPYSYGMVSPQKIQKREGEGEGPKTSKQEKKIYILSFFPT